MILPIVAYGHPVLRKICDPITPDYPGLTDFIASMWDTLYFSKGVGLAAPQVNKAIRIFVVDTEQIVKDFNQEDHQNFPGEIPAKKVFINAQKISETGNLWTYNEGCLSIPKIREDINRTEKVRIRYQDENFNTHEEDFFGLCGRVILHEYDHIEGKLFIDYLPQIKKRLIKKKLDDISSGKTKSDYKMIHHK